MPGSALALVVVLAAIGATASPAQAATAHLTLVSHVPGNPNTTANDESTGNDDDDVVSTSANGRFLAFVSYADNLVAGQTDTNARADAFLFDRATGVVTLVSHVPGSPTTTANGHIEGPTVSADGAFVVFVSDSTNLVAGQTDANLNDDVFLFERVTGAVTLVSHVPGSPTTTGNGNSGGENDPVISASGAFVAFDSFSTNLVTGQSDTNGTSDVFLFERATGVVTLASHAFGSAATTGDAFSHQSVISADGAFVAFESLATNFVAGQSGGAGTQIFQFERATGALTLVSHAAGTPATMANNSSGAASVSADGAFVAFVSSASNLVAAQSGTTVSVFLFERSTGTTTIVSHALGSPSATGNNVSRAPTIGASGAFVAFESSATNLVAESDANGNLDVFLFERATGTVTLVSRAAGSPTTANLRSLGHAISADGAFVAFTSSATNLVAGQTDANFSDDVFLFERATGTVTLVSRSAGSPTTTANKVSGFASISADGAVVAFQSDATNLVPGQSEANVGADVFLFRGSVRASPALFRKDTWLLRSALTTGGPDVSFTYGTPPLVPLIGDWTASGLKTAGTFEGGVFKLRNSNASGVADITFAFGDGRGFPVAGDFDGDGVSDVVVYRGGVWQVRYSTGATPAPFSFGAGSWPATVPVVGDWNGDGIDGIGTYTLSTGVWNLRQTASPGGPDVGPFTYNPGANAYPVVGDWDGDGTDTVGVKAGTTWSLKNANTAGNTPDISFTFGMANDLPLSWR